MKLIPMKKAEFSAVYDQLEQNFIREERRSREDAEAMLERSQYVVYHAISGDERVGFITVWELDGFTFAEHFVVYEAFRNRGYGAEILAALKEIYPRIVLEAEPPVGEMPRRRIGFYERNGFCRNPRPYFQPSYYGEEDGVELVVMSYPALLADFDGTVAQIYETVYGKTWKKERNDDGLECV